MPKRLKSFTECRQCTRCAMFNTTRQMGFSWDVIPGSLPLSKPLSSSNSTAPMVSASGSSQRLRTPGPVAVSSLHHLLHEQEETEPLPNRGSSWAGQARGQEACLRGPSPVTGPGRGCLWSPVPGQMPDLQGWDLSTPTPTSPGHRPFKQQSACWHARWVSQRPVPADSPTGSLLLPQPSPHRGN